MKIKKQKYRFIEINVKDAGAYTDIALVVDNLEFLKKIERVRGEFGLDYDYPNIDCRIIRNEFKSKFTKHNKLGKHFFAEIEKIRRTFQLPPHFSKLIKDAIVYGVVNNQSYTKAYLEEIVITPTKHEADIPDIKYAIIIHAGTRYTDVERVFKKFYSRVKVNLKLTCETSEYHGWADYPSQIELKDTNSTIKQHSSWYRQRLNGKKLSQLALDELHITNKQYNKFLRQNKLSFKEKDKLGIDEMLDKKFSTITKKYNSIKTEISNYKRLLRNQKL